MKTNHGILKQVATLGLLLMMGMSMSAEAGLFGFGGTSWKEEALQTDGSKIIVDRSVERGGRHELGQEPPIKEQSLSFTMQGTNEHITWEDHYSEDIGSASFLPMLLDIYQGTAYLVADTMGCFSWNTWGRPNPPYVIFQYHEKKWKRISLHELPMVIKTPNLIMSMPDTEVKKLGKSFITSEMIQRVINGYPQPEYRTILRTPVMPECPELEQIKGGWQTPGGPKLPYPIPGPDTKNQKKP